MFDQKNLKIHPHVHYQQPVHMYSPQCLWRCVNRHGIDHHQRIKVGMYRVRTAAAQLRLVLIVVAQMSRAESETGARGKKGVAVRAPTQGGKVFDSFTVALRQRSRDDQEGMKDEAM
ncbi:hypothetical protein F5888DRAFT_1638031 [Russula emetica]|nr:hypothetical protein F5888DRAFT_1638031 [Russula emetica]